MVERENKQPWQRMPYERTLWYSRFEIFRSLGPGRTLEDAWRALEVKTAQHPSWRWYEVSKEFRWRERAEAWDEYYIEQVRIEELEAERNARIEARLNRRALISGFAGSMATALTSYTESISRLEALVAELQRMHDRETEPDTKTTIFNRITRLTETIANLSSLPDVTKAMEMVAKQMRMEYGDFIGPEGGVTIRATESRIGVGGLEDENIIRVIVHD